MNVSRLDARLGFALPVPPHLPTPLPVGDHLALDFLNSVAGPSGGAVEWLGSGPDLLEWLEHAAVLEPDVVAAMRELARGDGRDALERVAAEARTLREWLRCFIVRHAGAPLPPGCVDELAPLNRLLAGDAAYRQIVAGAGEGSAGGRRPALEWRRRRRWSAPQSLLLPLAEAAGELLCDGDLTLVRRCEGRACTLMFYDRTKSHARRWCSMALCGNRAKAAAHRARRRERPAER